MFAEAAAATGRDADRTMQLCDIVDVCVKRSKGIVHIDARRCDRPLIDPFVGWWRGWDEGVHGAPHQGAAALSASSCPRRMRI